MIFSVSECLITFVALFVAAYLSTAVIDFKQSTRGVKLIKPISSILFPFCKLTEFNIVSICLQAINYVFTLIVLLGHIVHAEIDEYYQSLVTLIFVLGSVIITTVLYKKYTIQEENKK